MRSQLCGSWLAAFALAIFVSGQGAFGQFLAPDNGDGTANVPPAGGTYRPSPPSDRMEIIDGLPGGTTIEVNPDMTIQNPNYDPPGPGYTVHSFFDVFTELSLDGTGSLSGFHRDITIPNGQGQADTGPRTPATSVQNIDAILSGLQMQITGDPDFDLLRITAGNSFGMPSPGHTTLTQQPGSQWAVDSFFDITYRIDFVGHPGSPLGGMSGSTTGTIRMALTPEPATLGLLAPMGALLMARRQRRSL